MIRTHVRMLLLAVIMLLMLPAYVLAADDNVESDTIEDIDWEIRSQLGGYDLSEWQSELDAMEWDVFKGETASDIIYQQAAGEAAIEPGETLESILGMVRSELASNLGLLAGFLCSALIGGFADILIGGKEKSGLKTLTGFICYGLAVGLVVYALGRMAGIAGKAIGGIANLTEAVLPVMTTMLSAAGGIEANAAISPLLAFLSSTVIKVIQSLIVPIVLAGGVLALINNLTGRAQLGQLYSLSKNSAKWILGFMFTLYIGITAISGIAVSSVSGLSLKTAKFAIDKFVPIIGGMVSGTVDTVMGCSMIVKNAAGIASILIAVGRVASPLIQIACTMFTLRIAAAICEPIASSSLPKMLASVADIAGYLFAAVIGCGLMFIITIGIIIGTGNIYISG